jgi:PPOX class probable F420-dependent enzyme
MQTTDFSSQLVQDYLTGKEIAVLATVNPNGTPLATPMWFVHDDDGFGMVTHADMQKMKNLAINPNVSVVVESGSGGNIECVIVQGTVETLATQADRERMGEMFINKYGEHMENRWSGRAVPQSRALVRIRPTRVKLWGSLASD